MKLARGLRDIGQPIIVTVDGVDYVYSADKLTCPKCGEVCYTQPGREPICKLSEVTDKWKLKPVRPPSGADA